MALIRVQIIISNYFIDFYYLQIKYLNEFPVLYLTICQIPQKYTNIL